MSGGTCSYPRLVGDAKRNNTYDGILIDTGCRLFSFAGLQESATLSIQQPTKPIHRCGAEEARGAHNSEVARSKRVSGIIQFAGLQEPTTLSIQQPTTLHRHGAAAARGADNPEVTGSKPVAGILHSQVYKNLPRCQYSNTVIAMRR